MSAPINLFLFCVCHSEARICINYYRINATLTHTTNYIVSRKSKESTYCLAPLYDRIELGSMVCPKDSLQTILLTSMMFLLVRDSWGSLYSVYLSSTLSMSVLAYWYNLLLEEKMISAISQSHSTDNSYAFFITPNLRLLKVTWILKCDSILNICFDKNLSIM